MNKDIIEVLQNLYPLLPIIISVIGLRAGWVYKGDKIFNSRKAISEFSYKLYKNTNDEKFKKISEEYGIAALTKDTNLTSDQREILLSSKDSVKDIDNFSKCQNLLYIDDKLKKIQWKKERYRYLSWRRIVKWTSFFIYLAGSFITSIPFMYSTILYSTIFSDKAIEKINKSPLMVKFGLATYFILLGVSIAIYFLHKMTTISLAEKTMESNR